MDINLLIDAEYVQASNKTTFTRIDPVTDDVATTAAAAANHPSGR